MENLYPLTTAGLGDYYVLAKDPTEAQNALRKILDDQDYGISDKREVVLIKLISKGFRPKCSHPLKPFLSGSNERLLIVRDWIK